ncbi:arylsulfatase B-like [Watersipora subatra]|uniref:arylsulfatase B-like n=1 Tax=Watersipora subatra TaxID=2589382 RepID=UPI00355B0A44
MLRYALFLLISAVLYGYYNLYHTGSTAWKKPHVLFITADDLGYSDVGFRNKEIISPNIDGLAQEGVILSASYLQPFCTPSRAAILTGKYPYKIGMQLPFAIDHKACLPLNETLLSQRLKKAGYKTHALGKWHLGFCNWDCTPTRRGFDTFYGMYAAYGDKLLHINYNSDDSEEGLDFRDNDRLATEVTGQYSTDLYGKRAVSLIEHHNTEYPLFMWLAFQNVHSPVTVPDEYIQMYPGMDRDKASYYGTVTIVDEYMGKIIAALKKRDMYDNSLIIFTSDNGATLYSIGASNAPFRGEKSTVWEGGTRGVTLIAGTKAIKKKGYTHDGLFHAIDWTPTIMHFAQQSLDSDTMLDGVDQYDMIYKGDNSKRTEFIYQVMPDHKTAVRVGKYKLVMGLPGQKFHSVETAKERGFTKTMLPTHDIYTTDSNIMLFNLEDDPGETTDISERHPDIVKKLKAKVEAARADYKQIDLKIDPLAAPSHFDGSWSPGWC